MHTHFLLKDTISYLEASENLWKNCCEQKKNLESSMIYISIVFKNKTKPVRIYKEKDLFTIIKEL